MSRLAPVIAFVASAAAVASCYITDPDHCIHNGGNAGCNEEGFGFCSTCVASDEHFGCVADLPEPSCRPKADDVTTMATGSGTDDMTNGTPSGTDTDSMPTTGAECMTEGLDPECGPTAPYCIGGVCSPCSAAGADFCAGVDAGTPVCHGVGICTACDTDQTAACGGATPFCDAAGSCTGCTSHEQCFDLSGIDDSPQACNLETGECLNGVTFFVDSESCSGSGSGLSADDPYCDLQTALSNVGAFDAMSIWVKDAGPSYEGGFSLSAASSDGKYVAIVGYGGRPEIEDAGTAVVSVATSSNRLFLGNLQITGGDNGIRCTNYGRLWLDDVIVTDNATGIETSSNCRINVRDSAIHNNSLIGMQIGESVFRMVNTGVVANGTAGASTPGGISIDGAMGWDIRYSTLSGNRGAASGLGNDLTCAAGSPGTARNSVFMSESNAVDVDCPGGVFTNCAIDVGVMGPAPEGTGNVEIAYSPTYFVNDVVGDFHVRNPDTNPLADVAVWEAGDVPVDRDGDPRSNIPGARDWPGADVP